MAERQAVTGLGQGKALAGTEPCKPTYVEGYKPPDLLTKPEQMAF